ncbi:hypothetical protein BGW42_003911 [Actinomortierella wolfii]|nr:hypothetical protein BGW42_003911 [Actinomortierella wolfii]
MVSDEIPSSLEGVVWAAQLIVLRDMNEIRKGFLKNPLEKPSLPEEPPDGSRGHDRVRRYWIDRRGDDDGKKVRVWNNKDGIRLAEEHIPIWNLPVNSRCLQSTCQLKADIDQENDKFFAFMCLYFVFSNHS